MLIIGHLCRQLPCLALLVSAAIRRIQIRYCIDVLNAAALYESAAPFNDALPARI